MKLNLAITKLLLFSLDNWGCNGTTTVDFISDDDCFCCCKFSIEVLVRDSSEDNTGAEGVYVSN